ncbi:gluconate 2-dehydrogenase subunit 3 family protein [Sphingobium sp.]|uniref:gluconate 2-dehydrogenase subunit 3 family protein n=1 Tax=Sphingobium sp. TaxID=1912891 RepID=UPI0028BF3207|nr:gluconate 2-dehydrogenase subunit 3 family protein [Sphingobium sp.]
MLFKAVSAATLVTIFGSAISHPSLALIQKPDRSALSDDERALITDIADTIIPDTDTPGAKSVGVPDFIQHILFAWLDNVQRDEFMAGLNEFSQSAIRSTGKFFGSLSPADRLSTIIRLSQSNGEIASTRCKNFIDRMKMLTVYGYYTSEIGATQELSFNLITPDYVPCVHIGADDHAPSISGTGLHFH